MVDIKKMSDEYQHSSPVGSFTTSAGKFGCDVLELLELQGKLLKADALMSIRQSKGAAVTILVGSLCFLGCVPILILGIASAVTYLFDIPSWVSQLSVASCFAIISMILVACAIRTLSKPRPQFERSLEELSRNIEWAKNLFQSQSHR